MEKNEISREIDNTKLLYMFGDIRSLEAENLRTGKYSDRDMVKLIVKIIQKYAKG